MDDECPGGALVLGTQVGLYARVVDQPGGSFSYRSSLFPDAELSVASFATPPGRAALLARALVPDDPFRFVAGTVCAFLAEFSSRVPANVGLLIDNFRTTLPVRVGLSSSAAVCVLTARCLLFHFAVALCDADAEMRLALRGEHLAQSPCGRLDQLVAHGPRLTRAAFHRGAVSASPLALPPASIPPLLLVATFSVQKDTAGILRSLQSHLPALRPYFARLASHVSSAQSALLSGDAASLGRSLASAQDDFDMHCLPHCGPFISEYASFQRMLRCPRVASLAFGAKAIGAGGGGSVLFVARSLASRDALRELLRSDFAAVACEALDIVPQMRAVVPAAGKGTRMAPASWAVRKELFPVLCEDGVLRPILQLIVEEAAFAGCAEVVVVCARGDGDVQEYFTGAHTRPAPGESLAMQREAMRIRAAAQRTKFVVQNEPDGFGGALLCATSLMGGETEPFVVLLGDHLYRGDAPGECTRQVIGAFARHRTPVLGVYREGEGRIGHYGCLRVDADGRVLQMEEKPPVAVARDCLRSPALPAGTYYCVFGIYVVTPEVMQKMRQRDGKLEIGVTEALRELEALFAIEVHGERFDTGLPEMLHATWAAYSNSSPKEY